MTKYILFVLGLLFMTAPYTSPAHALEKQASSALEYYMSLNDALDVTPQTETKYLSAEHKIDLLNWPIPWEEQVRNGITNSGYTPNGKLSHDKKFWVPMDEIPGEDTFPVIIRMKLATRRGYQREVIHAEATYGGMQKEFSEEIKTITDDYKKGADDRLNDFVRKAEKLKSKNRNGANKNPEEILNDFPPHLGKPDIPKQDFERIKNHTDLSDYLKLKYKAECKKHFPEDTGGCSIIASSLVNGDINEFLVPLSQSHLGKKLRRGDVSLSYPGGRAILRPDPNGWVTNYVDPRALDPNAPIVNNVRFEKARAGLF